MSDWYVVLVEPQQEIRAVWRLHESGHELFTPVVRKRVKTGRVGKNGAKVTRIVAKPMFPGYGFIRAENGGLDAALATRGVRDVLKQRRPGYVDAQPVVLPDEAIRAVFSRQIQQQQEWIKVSGGRKGSAWKRGDNVKIDEGSVYSGLMATIDNVDSKGRVEIMLGMIRHTLPADMVVAA
ncbi:MAG: transcription antitermination protein nusG [Hyphomicrobiales bacterium]|nr:transcription antitermination protein nusG [Hyphomicrobiales bacterium]